MSKSSPRDNCLKIAAVLWAVMGKLLANCFNDVTVSCKTVVLTAVAVATVSPDGGKRGVPLGEASSCFSMIVRMINARTIGGSRVAPSFQFELLTAC